MLFQAVVVLLIMTAAAQESTEVKRLEELQREIVGIRSLDTLAERVETIFFVNQIQKEHEIKRLKEFEESTKW